MSGEVWWVVTTIEEEAVARKLARESVDASLAACAQVEPPVVSFYKWNGGTQEATEFRIVFKASAGKRLQLLAWIREHHPYEVPELLAWPVDEADAAYAKWVENS